MMTAQKLWQLLIPKQKQAAFVLFILMIFGMLLETLGVGLLVPALVLLTDNDLALRYPILEPLLSALGNPSHENLVIIGMLTLACVYGIKALFLAFLAWKQSKFVFGLHAILSQRLFAGYLRQPYIFHLQRNSAELIRNVTSEVSMLANVTQSALILLSEGIVLIGLSVLLFIVEPLGAILVITALGLAGWIFYKITRTYILRWGKTRQHHEGLRIQHLQQGLGGAKDVKLLGREEDFLSQYNYHSNVSTHVGQRQSALQQFPRLWLEFLSIVGLVALVFTMIGQGKPLDALLPTLGLFAAAAFRLMPSVNRVLIALQSLRFAVPVINTLHNELEKIVEVSQPTQNHVPSIKKSLILEQVSFRYPSTDKVSLQNINLKVNCGTSVGFIGGSGAGKSTLVDIILGLFSPDNGIVKVDGIDIQDCLREWQDQIGYVPQTIYLTDDSLRRNIAFGLSEEEINDEAVWQAVRAAQLEGFVSELPNGVNTVVGERGIRLSGGQRQRIGIARALYHDPPVLVLDEATSSLDTNTERDVMKAVQALRGIKTILIVAHRLSTVEHCDYLFRMERGRIVGEGDTSMILHGIA